MSRDLPSGATNDQAEQLLGEVVALAAEARERAFEKLLGDHPDLAPELRRRYDLFQRLAALEPEDRSGSPQRFGEYELVRELGRGGMGVVHLARQRRGAQERFVALKLVRDRGAFSQQARERLRREGAAAFRLDHAGICQVLDTGEVDGTPYLTMRYVPGRTLAEHIASARAAGAPLELPHDTSGEGATGTAATASFGGHRSRAVVALVEQVARALHVAHEAGFVHRDVKPGNIMVTPEGQPVLLDFGLVREEASDQGLTLTGQPLGTPTYMSPEQIEPRGRAVDRTTDVYSLGVTLYEALASRPPFEAQTREALFRAILAGSPTDLRRAAPFVSRDLRVVVETAMDLDPRRRYATALDFAEDLRRVRQAQPIVARPPSLARRLQLWCQRNPLAAVVLALLALAVVANVHLAVRAEQRAGEAETSRQQALADFASARDAVGELTMLARTHLSDVPWLEPVRREVFERALAFHRQFLDRRGPTPELRLDTAIVQVQCASLSAHLGDLEGARDLLARSVTELRDLTASGGDDAVRWMARAHLMLAQIAGDRGDLVAAEGSFRQAVAGFEQLAADRRLSVWEGATLLQAYRNLAANLEPRGLLAEANAAVAAGLQVTPTKPDPTFDVERARLLGQRARLRREQRDLDGAHADLQEAALMLRRLVEKKPHDRESRSTLAMNRLLHGGVHALRDEVDAAAAAYREARDLFEQLAAAFPHALTYRVNVATAISCEAALKHKQQGGEAGREALVQSIELFELMVRDDPRSVVARERLAQAHFKLAQAIRREDPERAIEGYRAALALADHRLAEAPADTTFREVAWRAANSLGTVLATAARDDEARAAFAAARGHGDGMLRLAPEDARWLRNQAMLLYNEGTLAAETGDFAAAEQRLREAVALDDRLVAGAPGDARTRADAWKHHLRLAQIVSLREPGAAAAAAWQRAGVALSATPEPLRQRLLRTGDAALDAACIERGVARACIDAGEFADGESGLARAAALLAGPGSSLSESVEWLLLELAQAARLQRSEAAGLEAVVRSALDLAGKLAVGIGGSRLHSARVAAELPALEALATRFGDAKEQAALQALRGALRPLR